LAHEQREATREYSAEEFLRHITLTLADRQGDGDIDAARAAELIAEARSHSEDEHTAVSWMSEVFSAVDQDWYDGTDLRDRKSTRLNSSHVSSSYAVFCLKKK